MAATKSVKVKLVSGIARASEDMLRTIQGLGLKKFGDERMLPDTPATRGMIFKVKHLVTSESVDQEYKPRGRRKPRKIVQRDRARAKQTEAKQA